MFFKKKPKIPNAIMMMELLREKVLVFAECNIEEATLFVLDFIQLLKKYNIKIK